KDMLVGRDVARIEMPVPIRHARVVGSIGLCPCGARRESGNEPQSRNQFLHGFLLVDRAPCARDLRETSREAGNPHWILALGFIQPDDGSKVYTPSSFGIRVRNFLKRPACRSFSTSPQRRSVSPFRCPCLAARAR